MFLRRSFRLRLPLALTLALAPFGCQSAIDAGDPMAIAPASLQSSVTISGQALVPASLISTNGGGVISNNGSGIIAGQATRYGLLSLDQAPLANALAYVTDPQDNFYTINGKMISTTTDAHGKYRFSDGLPRQKPVIVNVILSQNRRVVGFTVPSIGVNQVDVSLATTYVTGFLRRQATLDGKTMAAYDLKQLAGLAALTAQALNDGTLSLPDLDIANLQKMNAAYALAVGQNLDGLGDAWAHLIGHRIIAVTTVAGSGVIDNGGEGRPALEGQFYRLKGVCEDREGNIYLADEGNHRIMRLDPQTGLLHLFAGNGSRGFAGDGGPATSAMLNFPRSVVLDSQENLYIFDSQNARVRRVDHATGTITTVAGNPKDLGDGSWLGGWSGDGGPASEALLFSPRGGCFDPQGDLYVTDGLKGTQYNVIRKIDPQGIITTVAGVPNSPAAFDGDGGPATQAHLNYTNQLCYADNKVYIADSYNDCVRTLDLSTGRIATIAGIGGQRPTKPATNGQVATQAALNAPYGVVVDAKGDVFISEYGYNRVIVVKPDGKLYVLAGGGTQTTDGDGRDLSFDEPHDLFLAPDGNLLVAEARAGKLRRIWTQFGF